MAIVSLSTQPSHKVGPDGIGHEPEGSQDIGLRCTVGSFFLIYLYLVFFFYRPLKMWLYLVTVGIDEQVYMTKGNRLYVTILPSSLTLSIPHLILPCSILFETARSRSGHYTMAVYNPIWDWGRVGNWARSFHFQHAQFPTRWNVFGTGNVSTRIMDKPVGRGSPACFQLWPGAMGTRHCSS